MMNKYQRTVNFSRMDEGSAADYALLESLEKAHISGLPDRLLLALRGLQHSFDGFRIDRLQHSLQSATRAEADGADIEMIVGALIHDLGDDLAPHNHSQLAASIIRPYVRAEVTWVIEHHGIFQLYYFGAAEGVNKNERDRFAGHKWFESCDRFCGLWDQMSFDPDYPTKPLAHFEPMLREVFSRQPFDPAVIGKREQAFEE